MTWQKSRAGWLGCDHPTVISAAIIIKTMVVYSSISITHGLYSQKNEPDPLIKHCVCHLHTLCMPPLNPVFKFRRDFLAVCESTHTNFIVLVLINDEPGSFGFFAFLPRVLFGDKRALTNCG